MAERNSTCEKIKMDKKSYVSRKQGSTTEIRALPEEMLLFTLKKASLQDAVLNLSKVSVQWKDIVALDILKPAILKLANRNKQFMEEIERNRWTKDCKDSDLILSLYGKYQNYTCKYN